jgi:purine-binding chemotaxis protein CheW
MTEGKKFCTFVLNRLLFGVEVEKVREVIRYQEMTRVPLAPRVVKDLINLRGQLMLALDTRLSLDLPERPATDLPMNVVLRHEESLVALLVDEIGDVLEVDEGAFEAPPETLDRKSREMISGVYKLDGRLLHVLNSTKAVSIATEGLAGN